MVATRKLTTGLVVPGTPWVDHVDAEIDGVWLNTVNRLTGTGGTATLYTATASPPFIVDTLAYGTVVTLVPHVACGDSPKLNIDGLGDRFLKKPNGTEEGEYFAAGDMLANNPYVFEFRSTDFMLLDARPTATRLEAEAGITPDKVPSIDRLNDYINVAPYVPRPGQGIIGRYYGYDGTGDVSEKFKLAMEDQHDRLLSGKPVEPIYFPAKATSYHFENHGEPPVGAYVRIKGAGSRGGSYVYDSTEKPPTTWTGDKNMIPIWARGTVTRTFAPEETVLGRIRGLEIEDVCIEGSLPPTTGNFPYRPDPIDEGAWGFQQGINVRGFYDDPEGYVHIRRVRFQNIIVLPTWITGFQGVVKVEDCVSYKTRDFGIMHCNNVHFTGNQGWFGRDSFFSLTRNNRNVYVRDNYSFGQQGPVYRISGTTAERATTTIKLTGGSGLWPAGSVLTATLTGVISPLNSNGFLWDDSGQDFILNGVTAGEKGVVRMVEIQSSSVATVMAITAIPASLRGVTAASWSDSTFGAENYFVENNVAEWSGDDALFLTRALKRGKVSANLIRGAGWHLDSEVVTTGYIGAGSSTMVVDDTTGFSLTGQSAGSDAVGTADWVIMPAKRGSTETSMINRITAITPGAPGSFTLQYPAHSSRHGDVYRAERTNAGYGSVMTGVYETAGYARYLDGLELLDNSFIDCAEGGVQIGSSSSGSARNVTASGNKIFNENPLVAVANQTGIIIREYGNEDVIPTPDPLRPNMRQSGIVVQGNVITLSLAPDAWVTATAYAIGDKVLQGGSQYVCIVAHTSGTFATDLSAGKWTALAGGSTTGINASVIDTTATSLPLLIANDITADTEQTIIERAGGTEMIEEANASTVNRTTGALSRIAVDAIITAEGSATYSEPSAPSAWVTATAYVIGNNVSQGGSYYICIVDHTSGTFATDLAAAKWAVLAGVPQGRLVFSSLLNARAAEAGDMTITSMGLPGGPTNIDALCVHRNASASLSNTFRHDYNRLRCPGGVNYVLGPASSVMITRVTATVAQIVGKA